VSAIIHLKNMTDELKTVEKGTQSAFEKNLMSDLIDEYKTRHEDKTR
jgi:hypothetical protein